MQYIFQSVANKRLASQIIRIKNHAKNVEKSQREIKTAGHTAMSSINLSYQQPFFAANRINFKKNQEKIQHQLDRKQTQTSMSLHRKVKLNKTLSCLNMPKSAKSQTLATTYDKFRHRLTNGISQQKQE